MHPQRMPAANPLEGERGLDMTTDKRRILVVCTWPLGGIRTFLKYTYLHFPKERFEIIVLANPSLERDAFARDLTEEHIHVIWSEPWLGRNILFMRVARQLRHGQFDCIHSQGFTAAFHVAVANHFPRIPHVLTMHGILEPKYFRGWLGPFKRFFFRRVLGNVTVFHAVGQDMLDHFQREMPQLRTGPSRYAVIRNGIDVDRFRGVSPNARPELRQLLGCSSDTFVFGYFGRFMPEKGFDLIIKAAERLVRANDAPLSFRILAMGSGDYETWVKTLVKKAGLDEVIRFLPFRPDVDRFIKGCDAVVIPSRHEAFPLLPCEALVAGIPVIASDAMGLREAVRDTPAVVFPADDHGALAEAMRRAMTDGTIKPLVVRFQPEAAERFDVRRSAGQLIVLLEELIRPVNQVKRGEVS